MIVLESDGWGRATQPFPCEWCHETVSMSDPFWWAIFIDSTEPSKILKGWRVCESCAAVGPPLEDVVP